MNHKIERIIFTGTPGSGKSTVIDLLESKGYKVVHEVVTELIASEQEKGNLKPWEHPSFIDKISLKQQQCLLDINNPLQFFDRSIFCTYALAKYLQYPISDTLKTAVDHSLENSIYHKKVFFFENLGYIVKTNARQIDFEEALVFEKTHSDVYQQFGFELVKVPFKSIKERCDFILAAQRDFIKK